MKSIAEMRKEISGEEKEEMMVQVEKATESKETKFSKKIIALAEENGLTVYEFKQSIEIAMLMVENSKVSSDNGENERGQVAESAVSAELRTFLGESSEAESAQEAVGRKFRPFY